MELETAKIYIAQLVRRRDDLSLETLVEEIRARIERELSRDADTDGLAGAAEAFIDEIRRVFNPGRNREICEWASVLGKNA